MLSHTVSTSDPSGRARSPVTAILAKPFLSSLFTLRGSESERIRLKPDPTKASGPQLKPDPPKASAPDSLSTPDESERDLTDTQSARSMTERAGTPSRQSANVSVHVDRSKTTRN